MSVSLVIQYAEHMLCIILSSMACLALPYFSKLSHNFMILWKKVIEHKMYVLFLSTNFAWNISHSKKNSVGYYHKCM